MVAFHSISVFFTKTKPFSFCQAHNENKIKNQTHHYQAQDENKIRNQTYLQQQTKIRENQIDLQKKIQNLCKLKNS